MHNFCERNKLRFIITEHLPILTIKLFIFIHVNNKILLIQIFFIIIDVCVCINKCTTYIIIFNNRSTNEERSWNHRQKPHSPTPHSKATLTILEQLAITWLGHRNCNCETPCNLCGDLSNEQ